MNDYKLDNPVWYSLSEVHQEFAIEFNGIKFYDPNYCPFGGVNTTEDISTQIDEYSTLTGDFFVLGDKPVLSHHLQLKRELVCLQMIICNEIHGPLKNNILKLDGEHTDELLQLVTLVQPGYFKRMTPLLGNYYGIFEGGKLVAVTGERMKMNGFIEVSAVVTHPHHTGLGYAKQLIAHTVNNIIDQSCTPYLHVAETNMGAIRLYEKLGFRTRRKISFWNITR